ncbi:MAG: conjugal transfer protein TraX [Oscillospiraceae bacterium]|nr:conjugal transfer protein TraX [Oscillospiraceae bacterium]
MPKLNAFQLKWIAIVGMVLNHMVLGWWDIIPTWLAVPMYAAGGLTFPIMAYFVVEGYRHTRSLGKYMLRLALFGLIALPFHFLVFGALMLNILFTIVVSLFCLWLYDKLAHKRWLFWLLFAGICVLTAFPLSFDWAIIGPIVVMMTQIIKDEQRRRTWPAITAGAVFLFSSLGMLKMSLVAELDAITQADSTMMWVSSTFMLGCLAAALLLRHYNGQRGPCMKWAFYIAYPVHLAAIALLALAFGLTQLPDIFA